MSVVSENGTIEKHVADHRIAEVRVSQASRDMSRGVMTSSAKREEAIADIKADIEKRVASLRGVELRLSSLNAEVAGNRLPRKMYETIVSTQTRLKADKGRLLDEIGALKVKLRDASKSDAGDRGWVGEIAVISKKLDAIMDHFGITG